MAEEFEIQTVAQVNEIKNRQITNDFINEQIEAVVTETNISKNIEENINEINNQISEINFDKIDNINDKIDSLNLDILLAEIQDIIILLKKQNEKINNLESNINTILDNMG